MEAKKEGKKAKMKTPLLNKKAFDFSFTVSTGSTLLDLAISGGRCEQGGLCRGIMVEVFGPPSTGKTAILAEVCASAQSKGGDVLFLDPEGRLDREYSKIYGMKIDENNYYCPDTVEELFQIIQDWKPKSELAVLACDSLAALSTQMEMQDRDKMGMRRAKEFSEGLRKVCRLIARNGWILMCSNQIREGEFGEFVPGGKAISFYSSLRIRLSLEEKIVRKVVLPSKAKAQKVIGIRTHCQVKKNSLDDPFREADIFVIFGYGIDDIRGNLMYVKKMKGLAPNMYEVGGEKFIGIEQAIRYVEKNDLEDELKREVVSLWREAESKFRYERKPKKR